MATSLTGSSPSTGGLKAHCLSSGELNYSRRASAESPRRLKAEWCLSLERPHETSVSARRGRDYSLSRWSNGHVGNGGGHNAQKRCSTASAIANDEPSLHVSDGVTWFNELESEAKELANRSRTVGRKQAWDILIQDLKFCDLKARQDVLAIKMAHEKVVDMLNPLAKEWNSVHTLRKELSALQVELAKAHDQVHLSEARVSRSIQKLSEMEALVNKMLVHGTEQNIPLDSDYPFSAVVTDAYSRQSSASKRKNHGLMVAGPVKSYSPSLKNFWYPVAFTDDIEEDTMVPFECFEEPWVLFRGSDGRVGCVRNSCAHRACPLHLGEVKDGRIQCPYHGWEYATNGVCEKMPSTKPVKVSIEALPCVEREGMVWIWPGDGIPDQIFPSLGAPAGYTTHAQIVIELPVEHGLLMENLLDLAHAPFTHTSTFAKGWPVPSLVRFCTPVTALQGYWDPYPIDMEFQPPCMVKSTIGISKPGKLEGNSTRDCTKHLHQLHVCLPSSRGKTRLLYRLSLDFFPILKHIPFIQSIWKYLANQVLDEDLRLVLGQQERMIQGANVWNLPVAYDKLGVRYRKWRLAVEENGAMQEINNVHSALENVPG
ncbi:hypothetical protein KP509_13G051300 [Ceratopteris richardii]|uniref:Rieske domain-containing protein n=1 Tax=Ceratopteris richardii TaxID=49495 RepID=A0A8T2TFL2_CERRI|nr:hypothetical protein KP509_13G051300 [Ceratopteris richardii]